MCGEPSPLEAGQDGWTGQVVPPLDTEHAFTTSPDAGLSQVIAACADEHLILASPTGSGLDATTIGSLAAEMEIAQLDARDIYDVIVVGGGPAGLASGVCAATRGLTVLVIEGRRLGGQAGGSFVARAGLGLATGASSQDGFGSAPARRCPPRLATDTEVVAMVASSVGYSLETRRGETVIGRAIAIATGAEYRRLDVADYARFENRGIHYAATGMEAALCVEEDVLVVGGGASAAQSAVFLAGVARQVHVLVRGASLQADLSSYLTERLYSSINISIHTGTEVICLEGGAGLERIHWRNAATGVEETRDIRNLFVMTGAVPNTLWLSELIDLDAKGFVDTGATPAGARCRFNTSLAGVFAVGDVRSGSVKRVDAAVGEGVSVVADIARYIKALDGHHD